MKILTVLVFLLGFIVLEGCRDQQRSAQSENFQEYVNENVARDTPDNSALVNIHF